MAPVCTKFSGHVAVRMGCFDIPLLTCLAVDSGLLASSVARVIDSPESFVAITTDAGYVLLGFGVADWIAELFSWVLRIPDITPN